MADRIGIMYAGKMMEQASAMEMFHEPFHPYTLGLKNAFPSIKTLGRELISIPGSPPNLEDENPGCLFEARCPFAIPQCKLESPPPVEVSAGHVVHCIRTDSVEEFRARAQEKSTWHCSK
jgi:peptide/nickel transport system ATP-binding protein